jgi:hypothetical protein
MKTVKSATKSAVGPRATYLAAIVRAVWLLLELLLRGEKLLSGRGPGH